MLLSPQEIILCENMLSSRVGINCSADCKVLKLGQIPISFGFIDLWTVPQQRRKIFEVQQSNKTAHLHWGISLDIVQSIKSYSSSGHQNQHVNMSNLKLSQMISNILFLSIFRAKSFEDGMSAFVLSHTHTHAEERLDLQCVSTLHSVI